MLPKLIRQRYPFACDPKTANQPNIVGTWVHTYDANGNLRGDGVDSYTWDRHNRMVSSGAHSYTYDGDNHRISQSINSVVTEYLNDTQPGLAQMVAAITGSDTTRYVHSPRGIHAQQTPTGDWAHLLSDGLGSVRSVVDALSAPLETRHYDPYGNPFGGVGTAQTDFGFTGEVTDANEQLYLRARYYAPLTGTFTALDPWEGTPARPMSLNGYSWVEGNVVNKVDPSGWQACLPEICDAKIIHPFIKYVSGCFSKVSEAEQRCSAHCWRSRSGLLSTLLITDDIAYESCIRRCLRELAHRSYGCEISIKSYTSGRTPFNHAFLVLDTRLKTWGYRGGPEIGGQWQIQAGPHGQVFVQTGEYLPGIFVDYDIYDERGGPSAVLLGGPEACEKKACLDYEVIRLNLRDVEYHPLGPNSNTVVYTMMKRCGIPAYELGTGWFESLPGWYNNDLM